MKLNVPFYKSKKDTDCGPLALKMALEYLGEHHDFDIIAQKEKQISSGLVWSAGILRAARKLGFPAKMVSITNFSHETDDIDYYKKYSNDEGMLVLKNLIEENKQNGSLFEEKNINLEELLTYVTKDSIPIVLVNWNSLGGVEGFSGHFLLITGHDEKYVYVHNPGIASASAHLPLKRENFLKAWESKGTDNDTIIIFKKEKNHDKS